MPEPREPSESAMPDLGQRFVRVRRIRGNGFVEFDFAIGDPSLYIELILPRAAFDEFCARNQVRHMSTSEAEAVAVDMRKWRYGEQR